MSKKNPRAKRLISAINEKYPSLDVSVWQSGGGVATLYVIPQGGLEPDQVAVLAGPGTYDWGTPERSRFYWEDFSVGLDDQGESMSMSCKDVDELVTAVGYFAETSGWLADPAAVTP